MAATSTAGYASNTRRQRATRPLCTLTVLRARDALTLTMNRDDMPARPEAPPRRWGDDGLGFAAPVDCEAGGTWIGVNAAGVAACLLNRYDDAPKGTRSRGEVAPAALDKNNLSSASAAIEALAHRDYSPFTCLIVSEEGAVRIDWTGAACSKRDLDQRAPWMMTSSSWRFEAVSVWRQALFEDMLVRAPPSPTALSNFHCAIRDGEEAWAPMMRRDNAHTKSVTQVILRPGETELRYWTRDQALERGLANPAHAIRLARA